METFTREIGSITRLKDKVSTFTLTVPNTKVSGKGTFSKDMGLKGGPMERSMREIMSMEKRMDMANFAGKMDRSIKGNFRIITFKVKEPTGGPIKECSKATGSTTRCTEKVFSLGKTAENMKEPTKMTKNMATELSRGQTEECTKVCGKMENSMEKESTRAPRASPKKVNGKKEEGKCGTMRVMVVMLNIKNRIDNTQANNRDDLKYSKKCNVSYIYTIKFVVFENKFFGNCEIQKVKNV